VLRTDFPLMLATVARRQTRAVRFALFAQTWRRVSLRSALRARPRPLRFSASQKARCGL